MKLRTILLFGAPGSGKGTQGKILGTIPGYYHCACGDVFRNLNADSRLGHVFLESHPRTWPVLQVSAIGGHLRVQHQQGRKF